jgi:hypothetical protein
MSDQRKQQNRQGGQGGQQQGGGQESGKTPRRLHLRHWTVKTVSFRPDN